MNIAFATIFDLHDIRRGSGTFYFMSREIERQGHTVHYIGPLPVQSPWQTHLLAGLHRWQHKRYKHYLDPWIARKRGRQVTQQLAKLDYDVLLTNDYGIAGCTRTEKPVIVYTDAMIPHKYPEDITPESRISNLSAIGVKLFQSTIRRGLKNAQLCVFPAKWIMNEALQYVPDSAKMYHIPFGGNLDDPGPEIARSRRLDIEGNSRCFELLFVGKDWQRKGGDVAVTTVEKLQELGIDARLHVVGGSLPAKAHRSFVIDHGYLDKSVATQSLALDKLYRECNAFILPSVSEGAVMSAIEAAAYGLPTLAYDVPGVRKRVIDGYSGRLYGVQTFEAAFVQTIVDWIDTPSIYLQLVLGARKHFETTYNWVQAVDQLLELLFSLVR